MSNSTEPNKSKKIDDVVVKEKLSDEDIQFVKDFFEEHREELMKKTNGKVEK